MKRTLMVRNLSLPLLMTDYTLYMYLYLFYDKSKSIEWY